MCSSYPRPAERAISGRSRHSGQLARQLNDKRRGETHLNLFPVDELLNRTIGVPEAPGETGHPQWVDIPQIKVALQQLLLYGRRFGRQPLGDEVSSQQSRPKARFAGLSENIGVLDFEHLPRHHGAEHLEAFARPDRGADVGHEPQVARQINHHRGFDRFKRRNPRVARRRLSLRQGGGEQDCRANRSYHHGPPRSRFEGERLSS